MPIGNYSIQFVAYRVEVEIQRGLGVHDRLQVTQDALLAEEQSVVELAAQRHLQ